MANLDVVSRGHDFSALHAAMQRYVDQDILAGLNCAVLQGRDLVDVHSVGWASKERQEPLTPHHVVRSYSDSKLITSIAVMLLVEGGKLGLDDPVERYLPALGNRQVLRPGATSLTDTEPARGPITVRHLLTHTSGLSYGLLDPGTMIFEAYKQKAVLHPLNTLEQMVDKLGELPLLFHPGEGWEYSIATDVLGRLVEVVSGQRFGDFLRTRIFEPLGMADTGFMLREEHKPRFASYYVGADVFNPMKPGLTHKEHAPYPGAYLMDVPWQSGGGGLVSTLPDMLALLRSMLPGGPTLLKPETLALMMRNLLPEGRTIKFANMGQIPGKGFGLGGAVTFEPGWGDTPASVAEFQWGGLAGTHWWISPQAGLAGIFQTQRHFAFWHPYYFECKPLIYQAVGLA